jgi:hypothetical protein
MEWEEGNNINQSKSYGGREMKFKLLIEVESQEALRTILIAGRDYSMYDYKILNWEIP